MRYVNDEPTNWLKFDSMHFNQSQQPADATKLHLKFESTLRCIIYMQRRNNTSFQFKCVNSKKKKCNKQQTQGKNKRKNLSIIRDKVKMFKWIEIFYISGYSIIIISYYNNYYACINYI